MIVFYNVVGFFDEATCERSMELSLSFAIIHFISGYSLGHFLGNKQMIKLGSNGWDCELYDDE